MTRTGEVLTIGSMLGVAMLGSWALGEIADSRIGTEKAVQYAEQNNYTNVRVTDTDTFMVGLGGCDKGDAVAYEMTATAPNGVQASIIACGGILKGLTLRQG